MILVCSFQLNIFHDSVIRVLLLIVAHIKCWADGYLPHRNSSAKNSKQSWHLLYKALSLFFCLFFVWVYLSRTKAGSHKLCSGKHVLVVTTDPRDVNSDICAHCTGIHCYFHFKFPRLKKTNFLVWNTYMSKWTLMWVPWKRSESCYWWWNVKLIWFSVLEPYMFSQTD